MRPGSGPSYRFVLGAARAGGLDLLGPWPWPITAVMTPVNEKQSFIVKGTPTAARELEVDPDPIYVMVVGREPLFLGVKVPVVRWIGCPKGACPR
jgi:hypothetical protein